MCGIAGVLYADGSRPVNPEFLRAMGDRLAHRGPDGEGYWSEPGVGLVHRRLSIIDVEGGQQPIGNEDGAVQLVFNGEIYNFQALRGELLARGHRLRTRSDTEVLVHLYEDYGEALVDRLRGMFAFALWDRTRRQLLLARGRLGIKPLYIYQDDEKLLFASEAKAILAYPGFDPRVDPPALEDYLAFGMVPGPRSIFQGIQKLPPAHLLTARPDRLGQAPRRYWSLSAEPDENRTAEQWQEEIRAKLDETVRLHLIADVPVGVFLSGGVDSGAVTASASRWAAGLQSFSIGFDDESLSELPHARRVSQKYGTRHVEEIVTADAASLIDELSYYYDEPLADTSVLPTFLVARLAGRHVKVVLSGDGGDEAFGGYSRYAHDLREAAVRERLPGWFRGRILSPLARVWPKADWLPRPLRAKTLLTNLSLEGDAAYANTLTQCRLPMRRRLLAPDVAAQLNGHQPERVVRQGYAAAPPGDPLRGMAAADLATLLPDMFLVKVDRASMAHGVEARPPLLDHELFELAARIPSRFKVRGGETKWVFKQACGGRLPPEILRRKKQGFDVPIDAWLRGPLRGMFEGLVLSPRAWVADLIDRGAAGRLYRSHTCGVGRQGRVLWSLLVLARWADRYLAAPSFGGCPNRAPAVPEGSPAQTG